MKASLKCLIYFLEKKNAGQDMPRAAPFQSLMFNHFILAHISVRSPRQIIISTTENIHRIEASQKKLYKVKNIISAHVRIGKGATG